jgi:hypothetical protein
MKELGYMVEAQEWGYLAETGTTAGLSGRQKLDIQRESGQDSPFSSF